MHRGTSHRFVAVALVASTVLLYCNVPALAGSFGVVEGRVMAGIGKSPRSGAVVVLVDEATQKTYRSSTTDSRGSFRIESADPGTYRVLVDTREGAFLASKGLTVTAGKNHPVSLSLNRQAGETPPPPPPPAAKSGLDPWQKWLIVGGIAVGALLVVDAVTQDEKNASPF